MKLLEDKNFGGNKPYIDLTDVGQWGQSKAIAEHVGKESWLMIEKHIKTRVNGTCELCNASETEKGIFGQKANKFKIEFRYSIDDNSKIATLHRVMYVCASCSQMIHLRQTQMRGIEQYQRAIKRLSKVHNLQPYQVEEELHNKLDIARFRYKNGIPENLEVYIIEDGIDRLWKN